MASMTNLSTARYLSACMQIEQNLGAIYRSWSQSLLFDEDLRALWKQMESEEYDHASQIDMLRRLVLGADVGGCTIDDQRVLAMVEYTRSCLAGEQNCATSVQDALNMALQLEDQFRDFHVLQAIDIKDPALRKLFSNLSRDDESHWRRIRDARGRSSDGQNVCGDGDTVTVQ